MLVCQCHRVSDRAVAAVVDAGAAGSGQVVRGTRAGTDCGGCLPALRELCETSSPAGSPTVTCSPQTG